MQLVSRLLLTSPTPNLDLVSPSTLLYFPMHKRQALRHSKLGAEVGQLRAGLMTVGPMQTAVLSSLMLCPMTGPQGLAVGPDDGLLYVTVRSFAVIPYLAFCIPAAELCSMA